ncbi:hypothetical protein, partial [Salmonella enterica]|uniref:hypothetical protein n=1 Tax=Salmonella enterica TaxID=28901 RepID=UPI003CEED81F
QRCVDTDKTLFPDRHSSRYHDVGSNEYVVCDRRVMPHVVSAPQGDIIPNPNERLNGVIFQNETILPNRLVVNKDRGSRTDIARQRIAFL